MAANAIFNGMELAPSVILNRLCSTAKKDQKGKQQQHLARKNWGPW
jgi:hypothetical protein